MSILYDQIMAARAKDLLPPGLASVITAVLNGATNAQQIAQTMQYDVSQSSSALVTLQRRRLVQLGLRPVGHSRERYVKSIDREGLIAHRASLLNDEPFDIRLARELSNMQDWFTAREFVEKSELAAWRVKDYLARLDKAGSIHSRIAKGENRLKQYKRKEVT